MLEEEFQEDFIEIPQKQELEFNYITWQCFWLRVIWQAHQCPEVYALRDLPEATCDVNPAYFPEMLVCVCVHYRGGKRKG